MVKHGATADVGLPSHLVCGVENPVAVQVQMESRTIGDPLPRLAVVQRRSAACQLHRSPEYIGIHQRVWHGPPRIPLWANPETYRRTTPGSLVLDCSVVAVEATQVLIHVGLARVS